MFTAGMPAPLNCDAGAAFRANMAETELAMAARSAGESPTRFVHDEVYGLRCRCHDEDVGRDGPYGHRGMIAQPRHRQAVGSRHSMHAGRRT